VILDLTDVCSCENKELTKEAVIELTSFDSKLGVFPFIEKKPFELRIVNEENKDLLIHGETDVRIAIPCDRCLEEVPTDFHLVFDKKFLLEDADTSEEEMDEADYMKGFQLDIDKMVYDEILVNWPMKVLCREDCKGICKKCGTNLNVKTCDCEKSELDPRMAAIQDIFNKFKEV
jgi:uncharacterized protein